MSVELSWTRPSSVTRASASVKLSIARRLRSGAWYVGAGRQRPALEFSAKKGQELGNDLIGRFVDQPMARPTDDDALDVFSNEATLAYQELARGLLTSQHQHRHRQLAAREAFEILGVLLEGPEHLEPRSHGTWLCIGRRIELAIDFRNRAGWVGGEVVPEMLEVHALPTLDERQRGLAVEVEMPEVAEQPHVLPVADARQESVAAPATTLLYLA